MVQVLAFTQENSTQVELDVPEKAIELNYQFMDIDNPMRRASPYSFRFTLPSTKENDKFFSFYFDANIADGTFNATKSTECVIYVDGILLMQGSLQMFSVTDRGYEVNILEQIADVFEQIQNLTFPQLFTNDAGAIDTDLDHALTWDNVKDSWVTTNDITTGLVGDGTIVYPLQDGGQNTLATEEGTGTGLGFLYPFGMDESQLPLRIFKPAIRIAYLVEYIFNRFGYAVDSNFLNSADFQKVYMFLALHTPGTIGRATYGFKVGISEDILINAGEASLWTPIQFNVESGDPFYDPDGLITGNAFVAPFDGIYSFETNICVESSTISPYSVSVQISIDNSILTQAQQTTVTGNVATIVNNVWSIYVLQGQSCVVYAAITNSLDPVTILQTMPGVSPLSMTFFQLTYFITDADTFVDVSQNFPDIEVGKWLRAIVERFNLVIISDNENPGVMKIEPWSDYWAEGTTNKDWTEIVDQDSISISSTLEFQKKVYEFTDAEGKNFLNLWWQNQYDWIKGKYTYLNDSDLVTEKATTSQVFQPYRNRKIFPDAAGQQSSVIPNVLVPTFWDWATGSDEDWAQKQWVENKPVLAYYNGLQDIGNGGQFNFGGTPYSTYPYFSEYNEVGVSLTTKCLNWGYDWPDNFNSPFISGGITGGTTLNYAFHTYWSRLFNEVYSPDSRVMTCKVNLTYAEVYNLKFNDNLYLDGAFWKVLSITNYQIGGNGLANAKLVKVINKPNGRISPQCGSHPSGFNTDGTVSFVSDSTGDPVSPTETCCVLNGFVWDNANNVCFSRNAGGGSGGHGGGGNGGGGVGNPDTPTGSVINTPNSYTDFATSKVTTFQQDGVVGANISARIYATTDGTTPVAAQTDLGVSAWTVPLDSVMLVRVQAVAVETGGTAGTIGNSVSQQTQASIANTRTSSSAQVTARNVGTTTVLAENKDASTNATISITSTQARVGGDTSFGVSCVGSTNVKMSWFIDLELTTMQIAGDSNILGRPIFYNLDPNEMEYANLAGNVIMDYNL